MREESPDRITARPPGVEIESSCIRAWSDETLRNYLASKLGVTSRTTAEREKRKAAVDEWLRRRELRR